MNDGREADSIWFDRAIMLAFSGYKERHDRVSRKQISQLNVSICIYVTMFSQAEIHVHIQLPAIR